MGTISKERCPMTVCTNPLDYVRIALALETLAYHNKNYLDGALCSNKRFSEEIQALLVAALEGGDQYKVCQLQE